jgi:hypothetical protein
MALFSWGNQQSTKYLSMLNHSMNVLVTQYDALTFSKKEIT